ncbi:MAG: hypothetical protein GEV07_00545 [Streptosporangiales bacterium]|nr:hypothetical protein [Streptosporangiales bacterium]
MGSTATASKSTGQLADLWKLLYPRSITVIGASDNPVKLSGRPVDYLQRFGFTGRVIPINTARPQVQGLPAYRSLDEVPGTIDLAMIMLPAEQVPTAVRACGKNGISAAIVGASGFGESGKRGAQLQLELEAAIAETGVRVLGPNCLGMIGVRDRAVPTFTSALDETIELRDGPVAFVSQSGAFGSFVFTEALHAGIGISHYVNTGNEVDLSVADVLDALLDAGETRVLLAYLEGVSDGRRLLEVARRAHRLDKPILAVKVGRSEAGARAAQSHTASLAGEDAVFEGAAHQFGIVRVDGMNALLDAAQLFATGRRAHGRSLTTLSLSGGAGVLMADAASAHGVEITAWDQAWQDRMAAVLPPYGSPSNPIDLTAALLADPDLLRCALDVALAHPDSHLVAVLLGNADKHAEQLVDVIGCAHRSTDRPFVVVWTGGSGDAQRLLRAQGIPCYNDPGRAAAALGALVDYSLRPAVPDPHRPSGVDPTAARAVLDAVRTAGQTQLDEYASTRLIAAYGIPSAGSRRAATPEAAVSALDELGGPVTVKLLSHHVGHKSDIGGVLLDLVDADQVREAARTLLTRASTAELADAELLVQRMVDGDLEVIVGTKHDIGFGPVVVVGFGGVLVEVLADSAAAVAPVDLDTARRMLLSLRGSRLFGPVRGRPACDLDAIADVVVRVSWLATDLAEEVAELDVNPLLVDRSGQALAAVDCLARLTDVPTTP